MTKGAIHVPFCSFLSLVEHFIEHHHLCCCRNLQSLRYIKTLDLHSAVSGESKTAWMDRIVLENKQNNESIFICLCSIVVEKCIFQSVCDVRGSVANQSILYGYYILCSTPSAATKHLACKMTNSLCPCVYLELHTKFVASYFILWTAFGSQTLQADIIILLGMTKTSVVVYCLPVFMVWSPVCGCCDVCKEHSYVGAQNFDTKTPQRSSFANLRWRYLGFYQASTVSLNNKCDWASSS